MNVRLVRSVWILAGLLPVLAAAQAGKLAIPDFSDLSKKAIGEVNITLDGDMLKSATNMIGGGGGHQPGGADVSSVVGGLKAITIRSFKFDKPDMYSQADVESVLAQVNVPGWKKVIATRDQHSRVEIHMRENAADGGLLIVTEQPQELTIVNIAGKINMDQLRQLQGHVGVPKMSGVVAAPAAPAVPAVPEVATPAPAAPAAQQAAPASVPAHEFRGAGI